MARQKRQLKQILTDARTCVCWLDCYIKQYDRPYIKKIIKDLECVLINADVETLEEKY